MLGVRERAFFLKKKSGKTIKKLRWMSLEALILRLSGPRKLATVVRSFVNEKTIKQRFL